MTPTGRKAACVVMLLFVAGGALASATRFAGSASAAPPAPPGEKPLAPRDAEEKLAGHFRGRVNGPDGKPLRGAGVFLVPQDGASKSAGVARARTGADGRFAFDAPDMTYTNFDGLPARKPGLLIATAEGLGLEGMTTWGQGPSDLHTHYDPIQGAALTLQLGRDDVPIHGRFLDPVGRPLVGARVRVSWLRIPPRRDLDTHIKLLTQSNAFVLSLNYERELDLDRILGQAAETRTDADGRFKFSGLGRDRLVELRVSAPSVVDTALMVMTREAPDVGIYPWGEGGKPTQALHGAGFTLQLKPGRTVKGRVIDRDSHQPIPGMRVGPLYDPRFITDDKGRFTITGLDPELLDRDNPAPGWLSVNPDRVFVAVAPPGLPYQTAWVESKGKAEVVIACRRGIPFRLKLVDEQGRPVEAEVTYTDVQPNNEVVRDEVSWPVSQAARKADGTYEGYVLPGPGAVLVKTPRGSGYRAAHVDPKAFFAPGRTNWTKEEQLSAYGTQDTLTISNGRTVTGTINRGSTIVQRDYTAIVLVNPPPNSGALNLSATVVGVRPRR